MSEDANDPERVRRLIADYQREHGIPADAAGAPRPDSEGADVHGREFDLVVRGRNVSCGDHFAPREVGVRNGRIVAIEPLGAGLVGREVVELAEDEHLLPGLVDTHVHINEPGRTEWEGFASATRAAAAGGVTTVLDMPLNSIPATVNVPALEYKRLFAQDNVFVDVGFWGGAIPGNKPHLRELHDDGVFGFKCFLLHSGVDEFPHLEADEMEEDLAEIKTFDSLMIVHAEDSRAIDRAPRPEGDVYENFLKSRPRGAENLAIAEVIERTRWTGARSHILHLSSSDALPMIATAKRGRPGHHGRDLPALPHPARRGGAQRGHRLQVLPARAGGRQPRAAVGGADRRDHRLRRLRPLPLDPGPEGPGQRGLRRGLGRSLLPAARASP